MRKSIPLLIAMLLLLICWVAARLSALPAISASEAVNTANLAQQPVDGMTVRANRENIRTTDENNTAPATTATITVSGTVIGPDGPVPDAWIGIGSVQDWQETWTDPSGFYSVSIQTPGELWFHVRPEIATRLTQINHWKGGVTNSFTQDFSVTDGHLLSVRLVGSDDTPITGQFELEVQPLEHRLPGSESYNQWYSLDWDGPSWRHQAVLPPDVYYVTAHNPPAGSYQTTHAFDLRSSDQVTGMLLNTTYIHPIPYDPPDAAGITIGPVDDLGEATVTGRIGAALPLVHILLVNLNSSHQAHAISEADGSFSARIYATPGSSIMVKHGPPGPRWHALEVGVAEGLNPFPGTILYVPHTHSGEAHETPFASVGAIDYFADDPETTRNYVGSAWAMTGTISVTSGSDSISAGDPLQIRGTVRLYSPAITATTDLSAISANGPLAMRMLFDEAGGPRATQNTFMSTILTPSGLPIQRTEMHIEWTSDGFEINNWRYSGGHNLEGDVLLNGRIPDDLPPGIYGPLLFLYFTGVPTSTKWLAANVTRYSYSANEVYLPPIVVGPVDPPRLIWRLLMDDFVQGTRGSGAREDQGRFELSSQIVSQGAPHYVPQLDGPTGQPITYRLEPFLPMISFTDRRMPSPPLIPLDLPGGQLRVLVEQPDGTVRDLGGEAFAQSFNRTRTTRAGHDLNSGTVQLEDVYSLRAASDRFLVTFDQYGHHTITMTGTVSDVWGNDHAGGGTYDLWVAHRLDIDPGALPGTPLAVDDTLNPAVQFYPRVPADVSLTLTLYPASDPAQAVSQSLTGRANPYGYYSQDIPPIPMTHPGEYRVDLTAIYTATSGEMYMGAMTWGGVVMTPEDKAQLVAHGRRGLDSLEYIPNHWFVASRDLIIPGGAVSHSLNPYYNGDILWSRMSDGPYGGDSLLMGASVHDTLGVIAAAVQARADRVRPEMAPPGSLGERFDSGEIPLFSSTRSGRPVQAILGQIGTQVPADVDQISYSYRTSQRPGMRVREVVAEDGESGGYWRLNTLYDDQLGVGMLGDQPNDFKFQYVGIVYRDLDSGHNEYVGQGSGWVFIPDDDTLGSRVMPPYAGPGNGGWTTQGGPILTLKGKEVHIFILPTGTRPGAVLEVGDIFRFAGHLMPTLDSQVAFTVTTPSGVQHTGHRQANAIGYYYDPVDDFAVNEPGLWSVDVRVWHDGLCSGGQVDCDPNNPFDPARPCPTGDLLGSESGRYWFYVVPSDSPRLNISSPSPGLLSFGETVTPITITGSLPAGLTDASLDYTISMPGYVLDHGQATLNGDSYQVVFDPVALHEDFPNLDLIGRDDWRPGLADTFAIGLFLQGQRGGEQVYRANTITLQGNQVFIGGAPPDFDNEVYLPLVVKGG